MPQKMNDFNGLRHFSWFLPFTVHLGSHHFFLKVSYLSILDSFGQFDTHQFMFSIQSKDSPFQSKISRPITRTTSKDLESGKSSNWICGALSPHHSSIYLMQLWIWALKHVRCNFLWNKEFYRQDKRKDIENVNGERYTCIRSSELSSYILCAMLLSQYSYIHIW